MCQSKGFKQESLTYVCFSKFISPIQDVLPLILHLEVSYSNMVVISGIPTVKLSGKGNILVWKGELNSDTRLSIPLQPVYSSSS